MITLIKLVCAVFCLTLCALPSGAQHFRPRIRAGRVTLENRPAGVVRINEQAAFILRCIEGGHGPEVRAAAAAQRLDALVGGGVKAGEFTAHPMTKEVWAVMARGVPVLYVTPTEAQAHRLPSRELAQSWAGEIRRLLSQPILTLTPARLIIPLGETRTVQLGGAALAGDISADAADPKIAPATYNSARRLLTVGGLATGRSTISLHVRNVEGIVTIPLVVMKYAAQITPAVTVSVTGTPSAPSELVAQAIYAGLSRAADAEVGTRFQLLRRLPPTSALPVGTEESLTIPLRFSGPDYLTVEGNTLVTIVNTDVPARNPDALFYSNNPEQVQHAQTLFSGALHPFHPARLDYHHQNSGGDTLFFHADLVNDTDASAKVQVVSGIAAPGSDPVQVGRRGGVAFLRALNVNAGIVVDVPAHSRIPVVAQRFANGLTVSGVVQFQQIGGSDGTLKVCVAADNDGQILAAPMSRLVQNAFGPRVSALDSYGISAGESQSPMSPYAFGAPQVLINGQYTVGKPWCYVHLGHSDSLKSADGRKTLFGNYGVTHSIAIKLSNPTSEQQTIRLLFAPEAGPAAGVFQVDNGQIIEFDPQLPPTELELARFVLGPGQSYTTTVKTIPLNGSAYPASLVVHAL